MLIGFTGERGAGKTTLSDMLVKHFGFKKMHAFGPGKVMTVAYLQHLGMDQETACRCVYGDLKDTPHPLIPGDGLPRTFMEELGKFMGTTLGPAYTLGVELDRAARITPGADYVIESVVYEADSFVGAGGVIINVTRKQNKGKIEGRHTDKAVASIKADYDFTNDFDVEEDTLRALTALLACIRVDTEESIL